MNVLKSYNNRVGVSSEVGALPMDIGSTGSGLISAGSAITEISNDYQNRKNKAKAVADQFKYKEGLINLDKTIETKTSEEIRKGTPIQDIHSKVVEPLLGEFEAGIQNIGLNREGAAFVENNWKIDKAQRVKSSELAIEQRENSDILSNLKKGYMMAVNTEDAEGAEKFIAQIENMAGVSEANKLRELGVYGKNVNKLYSTSDPDEINRIMNSDEAKGMKPNQYQQFSSLGRNHLSAMTREQYAPIKRQALKDIKENTATPESINSLDLPNNEKQVLLQSLDADITKSIELNEVKYDEAMTMVDNFLDGKYGMGDKRSATKSNKQYDELLENLKELELPANVIAKVMDPIISAQEESDYNYAFYSSVNSESLYDVNVNKILNEYRQSHSSANAGLLATSRVAGFGNGYRHVMNWIQENKKEITNGTIPDDYKNVIRTAVMPAVERRNKEISAQRAAVYLQDSTARAKQNEERLNAVWSD